MSSHSQNRLERLVAQVIAERSSWGPPVRPSLAPVSLRPTRNDFLRWLYECGLVEASAFSAHCADKLFFARLLERAAPAAYREFHPATFGLGELGSAESVRARFPNGFVAKPVAGMNSDGRQGIFFDDEFFLAFAADAGAFLPAGPVISPLTGVLSSGELYLIQEKLERREEYRLHTFEDQVLPGATFTRWDAPWDLAAFARAEAALGRFLSLLPPWMTAAQAWSVDLMETRDGRFLLVEVNSNRGNPHIWSGDLAVPDTLAAYVRYLERERGARFLGEGGEALRRGEANRQKFIEKFGAEAVARHEALRAAARQADRAAEISHRG